MVRGSIDGRGNARCCSSCVTSLIERHADLDRVFNFAMVNVGNSACLQGYIDKSSYSLFIRHLRALFKAMFSDLMLTFGLDFLTG